MSLGKQEGWDPKGELDFAKSIKNPSTEVVLQLSHKQDPWRACGNPDAGPISRVSDSFTLGWDHTFCISNTFLGDGAAAGPRTHLEKHR